MGVSRDGGGGEGSEKAHWWVRERILLGCAAEPFSGWNLVVRVHAHLGCWAGRCKVGDLRLDAWVVVSGCLGVCCMSDRLKS